MISANFVSNRLEATFVYLPPGTFRMGDENASPVHEVTLTAGFFMQTTPVTQKQWQAVMGTNPSRFHACGPDCPVDSVSWKDVQSFLHQLNRLEKNNRYDLPTEAQWEYACRAGSVTRYCFGDSDDRLEEYAWFDQNSRKTTHPVARRKPNDRGLYDMHGNVWEWCRDWYGDYPDGKVSDPQGPKTGSERVIRGGSWNNGPGLCRSAARARLAPDRRRRRDGFRLVLPSGQQSEAG